MFNPFAFFVSLKAKLIGLAVVVALSFGGGWYVHGVFYDAAKHVADGKKLDKAQKAPGAIMKKNQELRKTDADKDPCFAKPMSSDVLKLLH